VTDNVEPFSPNRDRLSHPNSLPCDEHFEDRGELSRDYQPLYQVLHGIEPDTSKG